MDTTIASVSANLLRDARTAQEVFNSASSTERKDDACRGLLIRSRTMRDIVTERTVDLDKEHSDMATSQCRTLLVSVGNLVNVMRGDGDSVEFKKVLSEIVIALREMLAVIPKNLQSVPSTRSSGAPSLKRANSAGHSLHGNPSSTAMDSSKESSSPSLSSSSSNSALVPSADGEAPTSTSSSRHRSTPGALTSSKSTGHMQRAPNRPAPKPTSNEYESNNGNPAVPAIRSGPFSMTKRAQTMRSPRAVASPGSSGSSPRQHSATLSSSAEHGGTNTTGTHSSPGSGVSSGRHLTSPRRGQLPPFSPRRAAAAATAVNTANASISPVGLKSPSSSNANTNDALSLLSPRSEIARLSRQLLQGLDTTTTPSPTTSRVVVPSANQQASLPMAQFGGMTAEEAVLALRETEATLRNVKAEHESALALIAEREARIADLERQVTAAQRSSQRSRNDGAGAKKGSEELEMELQEARDSVAQLTEEKTNLTRLCDEEFERKHEEIRELREFIAGAAFEGWLEKQGGGKFSAGWRSRFFVLKNGALSYYVSEDDDEPKGFIFLSDATLRRTSGTTLGFELRTPARTYFLQAQDKDQLQAWMDKLTTIEKIYKDIVDALGSASSSRSTVASLWRKKQVADAKKELLSGLKK